MTQRHPCPISCFLEFYFEMVEGRVRHEHRTAQLEQDRRLDDLYVPPEMLNPMAPVPKPSAAGPFFQLHVHWFAIRAHVALAQPFEHALENLVDRPVYVDVLLHV